MGIVRIAEWHMCLAPDVAAQRLGDAFTSAGMESAQEANVIRARSKRSIVKNRWAAEVEIQLLPLVGGSGATCRVEMMGTKHFALLDEIIEAVGDDAFDSRGIDDAIGRLGKKGRLFGRKELRHLQHVIHMDEKVVALAQGVFDKKQGLVILSDQRLFFLEKSLGHESLHEFALSSINSLEVSRKRSGERLVIRASGDRDEIAGMTPGQADEIARTFTRLRLTPEVAPATSRTPEPDLLEQIRKLGELRDGGVLTAEEFEVKKAELLERL